MKKITYIDAGTYHGAVPAAERGVCKRHVLDMDGYHYRRQILQ